MHRLEEASASQIRQPWRVIAIGAVGQRPRVPDVRMGAPAGSGTRGAGVVRCGEGDRGAPASVDATTSTHTSSFTPTGIHKLYERVVASYLRIAYLEKRKVERWTGLSLAHCATLSTRSLSWPDSVRGPNRAMATRGTNVLHPNTRQSRSAVSLWFKPARALASKPRRRRSVGARAGATWRLCATIRRLAS